MKKMMTRRVRKRRRRRMTVMKTLRWRRPGKEGETETETEQLWLLYLFIRRWWTQWRPLQTLWPSQPSRAVCDTLLQKIFNFSQSGVLLLTSHFRSPDTPVCSVNRGYHTACRRPPLMIHSRRGMVLPPLPACESIQISGFPLQENNNSAIQCSCSSFLLQKQLCDRLEEQLLDLDAALKKKERSERRWIKRY